MPYTIFPELINMSLTAAAVILIVALLRSLLRRAPRAVTFLLWAVVLFRLVCPVSFSADFSLMRAGTTVDNRIQYVPTELIENTLQLNSAQPSTVVVQTVTEIASGSAGRTDFARLLLMLGTWIWIIGMAALLVGSIVSLIRLRRRCIGAVRLSGSTYLADNIHVPFVIGILRPRIYLPSTLTEEEQALVARHEDQHILHGDHIWKLIAFLALTLHWFNPVVWLGFYLFVRDMEAACDERVLAGMDDNTRADYASTLLRIASGRRFPSITPAFGEENPKSRIKTILQYKKPLKIVTIIAVVLAVAFAVFMIVNPTAETGRAGDIIPEFPHFRTAPTHYSYHQEPNERGGEFSESQVNPVGAYAMYDFFKNLTIEAVPAGESRAEDRASTFTFGIGTENGMTYIHFDENCKRMWIDNGVKPSYTYAVKDDAAVRQFYWYTLQGNYEQSLSGYDNFEAASDAYSTVVYCPAADQNSGSIKIGMLQNIYIKGYLLTKIPGNYLSDSIFEGSKALRWLETPAPKDTPPSPESVEFILDNDRFRLQIWKSPNLAVIRIGEYETWYTVREGDYEAAVDLVLNYCLTQEESAELLKEEASAEPSMSPTPKPAQTPSPTEEVPGESVTEESFDPEPTPGSLSETGTEETIAAPAPTTTPESSEEVLGESAE